MTVVFGQAGNFTQDPCEISVTQCAPDEVCYDLTNNGTILDESIWEEIVDEEFGENNLNIR